MQVVTTSGPAFAFGEITLPPGGRVRVEAGAMAMTRAGSAAARGCVVTLPLIGADLG